VKIQIAVDSIIHHGRIPDSVTINALEFCHSLILGLCATGS